VNPINIIGAGMAGSILAKLFRKEGIKYNIFDSEEPNRASRMSENLIGLRWYQNEKPLVRRSTEILKSIVPTRLINGLYLHVYTDHLLEADYIKGKAIPDSDGVNCNNVHFRGFNIVCAGAYSGLITSTKVSYSVGHGIIYRGSVDKEIISPYRPFKFDKLINRNPNEAWYSNSLEVTPETYAKHEDRYMKDLLESSKKFTNLSAKEVCVGYRPKTLSHNNFMTNNGILVTGGRTQGMIRYPIQCEQVVNFIKDQKRFLP